MRLAFSINGCSLRGGRCARGTHPPTRTAGTRPPEWLAQAYEARQRALGGEHPNTLTSLGCEAQALSQQGEALDAEALHRQVGWVRAGGLLG